MNLNGDEFFYPKTLLVKHAPFGSARSASDIVNDLIVEDSDIEEWYFAMGFEKNVLSRRFDTLWYLVEQYR